MRTLLDSSSRPERRTALVARELARYKIDIAALSETRLAGEGQLKEASSGYTFFWKGREPSERRESGVGFAIKNKVLQMLDGTPIAVSDRLMHMRLPLTHDRFATIISVYAPTMTNPAHIKEVFYAELNSLIRSVPRDDKLLILGDFNARVGQDHAHTWANIIGRHGVGSLNSNGLLLLELCAEHNLTVMNTMFRLKNKHKTTWMHPRSHHWHLLDYLLVRQRDRKDVHVTRAMRGADCGTDHHMVRSKITLLIRKKTRKTGGCPSKRFNVAGLSGSEQAANFSNSMSIAMDSLPPFGEDVEEEWTLLRDSITKTATDCLGFRKRNHADWFDENDPLITDLLERRRNARTAMLMNPLSAREKQDYNKACSTLQRNLRVIKDDWFNKKAEELQQYADCKDYKAFYDAIKQIYGPTRSVTSPLLDLDGRTVLTNQADIARRWNQHFDALLNCDSHVEESSLGAIKPRPVNEQMVQMPTQEEVLQAIKAMRNNKSPGLDGIPAEKRRRRRRQIFKKLRTQRNVRQGFDWVRFRNMCCTQGCTDDHFRQLCEYV